MTLLGVPIDDHFWPSIYPGLFIGIIYGLSAGGGLKVVSGLFGGMVGGIAAFLIVAKSGIEDGPLPLAFLIAVSALGAYLLVQAVSKLTRRRSPDSATR